MSAKPINPAHSKNTPKIGYSDQPNVKLPGAFEVEKFDIIDSQGVRKDIRSLVESFTITSELFSPVLTLSASLRDTEKLFEPVDGKQLQIYGQENIEIKIKPGIGDAIEHTFSVKEYPTLVRTLDFPHTQIYTLLAISEFAYRSSLMNICRVLDDGKSLDKNIETIFKDDLGLKEFNVEGDIETKFKGIINIQRPLQAAEWLRSRCFTENGSPFFLYSNTTRPGEIFLSSWSNLSGKTSPIVAKYVFKPFIKEEPGTAEHTTAERNRLLSMTSSIKLDRLKASNAGAYASRYNVIDFSSKAFYVLDFNGKETSDWKPRKYNIKDRSGNSQSATMHTIASSNVVSVHVNRGISETGDGNSGGVAYNSITACERYLPPSRALYARLNEVNHDIVVYGDTAMQPGVKINLKVPKPKLENDRAESEIDELASGDYVILVASSIFSNGIHTNKLKVAKLVPSVEGNILDSVGPSNVNQTGQVANNANINPNGTGKTAPTTENQKAYYTKMYNALYKEAVAKGLPNPDVVARLGAAQTCLETGYGTRMVGNNAFGIKAHTGSGNAGAVTASTKEVINGKTITINDSFRAYNSVEDSAVGYIDFLTKNKRYSTVLASTNIDDAVTAIGQSGYATSPVYARDVGSIARKFQYEN
jgi:flagellum-specific peptidoglycan hydrolase FlgJ